MKNPGSMLRTQKGPCVCAPDLDSIDARLEVGRHLHELELRRPLETLIDLAQREQARQTRAWFRAVFLRSPPT
jgi:hypothetical protein